MVPNFRMRNIRIQVGTTMLRCAFWKDWVCIGTRVQDGDGRRFYTWGVARRTSLRPYVLPSGVCLEVVLEEGRQRVIDQYGQRFDGRVPHRLFLKQRALVGLVIGLFHDHFGSGLAPANDVDDLHLLEQDLGPEIYVVLDDEHSHAA